MARNKPYKIKRYYQNQNASTFRARPHPISILLSLFVIAGLVFVGISLYQPVYDLIMGNHKPSAGPDAPPAEVSEPAAPADGADSSGGETAPVPVQRSALHMAYLPHATAGDEALLDAFLAQAKAAGANAVLLDIKDRQGMLLYRSAQADAVAFGAVASDALDLAALSAALERKGFSLAVRMSVFCDTVASNGNRDNAVRYRDTEARWLDAQAESGGKPWLNPYAPGARQYITDLAVEAVKSGAKLVILQDFQFADGSDSPNANFGESAGTISRSQVLSEFVAQITAAVEAQDGRLGVYLPVSALTETARNEVRYGGDPLACVGNTLVLGLLPYQFGNGFDADGLVIESPYQDPAETVATAIAYGAARLSQVNAKAAIIPLLQGGAEPLINTMLMDAAQVKAQVSAALRANGKDYILYQSAGEYAT